MLVDEVQPMGVSVEQWEAGGLNVEGGGGGSFCGAAVRLVAFASQSCEAEPVAAGHAGKLTAIASRPTQLKF